MAKVRGIAAAFVISSLLSSCALFRSAPQAMVAIRVPDQQGDQEYGMAQMELGRKMLDEGHYAQAVIAFRNAQRYAEHAAGAHNGLGIAYAQLGRPDLAEQYFKQAMVSAPGDRRYQANLDRFYESETSLAKSNRGELLALGGFQSLPTLLPTSAKEVSGAVSHVVSLNGSPVGRTIHGPVIRIELPTARRVNVSRNEVLIETALPELQRRAPGVRTALASAANDGKRRNAAYPVRIQLGGRQ